MKKGAILILAIFGIMAMFIAPAPAEKTESGSEVTSAGGAVNIGNKICPVSGEEIGGEMGEGVEVEHEGKVYKLCCRFCQKDFEKDPEKFIEKMVDTAEEEEAEE